MSVELIPAADAAEAPARRHKWGEPRTVLPADSPSGCEETERHCTQCAVVKLTIHPPKGEGHPWRAWRHGNGERWHGDHAPPCRDGGQK